MKVLRKQRHTAKRVFDRRRGECGFTGGYTIIKDYMREQDQWLAGPRLVGYPR